jgi:hypothetical protein
VERRGHAAFQRGGQPRLCLAGGLVLDDFDCDRGFPFPGEPAGPCEVHHDAMHQNSVGPRQFRVQPQGAGAIADLGKQRGQGRRTGHGFRRCQPQLPREGDNRAVKPDRIDKWQPDPQRSAAGTAQQGFEADWEVKSVVNG